VKKTKYSILRAASSAVLAFKLVTGVCFGQKLKLDGLRVKENTAKVQHQALEEFFRDDVFGFSISFPKGWKVLYPAPSRTMSVLFSAFKDGKAGNAWLKVYMKDLKAFPQLAKPVNLATSYKTDKRIFMDDFAMTRPIWTSGNITFMEYDGVKSSSVFAIKKRFLCGFFVEGSRGFIVQGEDEVKYFPETQPTILAMIKNFATLRITENITKSHNVLYKNAMNYLGEGDYLNAEKSLAHAIRKKPNYMQAHALLGGVYRNIGRPSQALIEIMRALTIKKDSVETRITLAGILEDLEQYGDALVQYQWLSQRKPEEVDFYVGMGNIYEKLNELSSAVEEYTKAVRVSPDSIDIRLRLAEILEKEGEYREASNAIQDILTLYTNLKNESELEDRMEKLLDLAYNRETPSPADVVSVKNAWEEAKKEIVSNMQKNNEKILPTEERIAMTNPAVVVVKTLRGSSWSIGSGVIFSSNGFIITNEHVIRDAHVVRVKTLDKSIYAASIIAFDTEHDLALLKIAGKSFSSAALGDSNKLGVGEEVIAIGSPISEELEHTVTKGIISAKNRKFGSRNMLQTDVAINQGNSGGPLIDKRGKVVGINTMIIRENMAEGLNFAIPSNMVIRFMDNFRYGDFNIQSNL